MVYPTGTEFRIDYIIVSAMRGASFHYVYGFQDYKLRESKISDHSPLIIDWKKEFNNLLILTNMSI